MDTDTEQAALAHQMELEAREYQEMLSRDSGYLAWLDQFNQQTEQRYAAEHY